MRIIREDLEEEYYDMNDGFFNYFIINSFCVTIYIDSYKLLHKNKFYKDLYR